MPRFPGDRADNLFMCYDEAKVAKTAAEWDAYPAVHKTHFGYYTWPKKMLVYDPKGRPKLDRTADDMNDVERIVFEFFQDEKRVDKLVEFLSLEEHKGRDKFDSRKFLLFKGLFRWL